MHPTMKKHLQDRPFATQVAALAEGIDQATIITPEQAQVSTTAMIAYGILDLSDAVRELTAALEQKGDQR